jgi:hypothetical protein
MAWLLGGILAGAIAPGRSAVAQQVDGGTLAPPSEDTPSLAASNADWRPIWVELARWKALGPESEESHRGALALARIAATDSPRARLLRAQLARRLVPNSRQALLVLDGSNSWPFDAEESWLAAEVIAPGAARARAVTAALQDSALSLSRADLLLAWNVGVEEATALRFHSARAIQTALHARYRAPWSAVDLALSCARAGSGEEADRVLAEIIEDEARAGRPAADLWSQRGILSLGRGSTQAGRDQLGRAMALGSWDATVVLARLDLSAGRLGAARAGFRAALSAPAPSPWAYRGWGVALVSGAGPLVAPPTSAPIQ